MAIPKKALLVILLILLALLYGFRLGILPLFFEEPRRAIVALEMMLTHNYWIPKINGFDYFNKPPVYNWLLILFFKVFGTSEWVVRLPTVLSAWGMAATTFFFFRKKIDPNTALLAGIFILTGAHMLFYFSFTGEIDLTYSFLVYLNFLAIIHGYHQKQFYSLYLFSYLLTAVGFLMKGFPSIAFQGLSLIGIALYHRDFRFFFHPAHLIAGTISVGLMSAYFLKYDEFGDPFAYMANLLTESSRRTTNGNWIKYLSALVKLPGELLKITFPWCLLLMAIRWNKVRIILKENPWVGSLLLLLVANGWLYWISPGTKDRYLYMFLPLILVPLAYLIVRAGIDKRITLISQALAGTIASLLVASIFFFPDYWYAAFGVLIVVGLIIVKPLHLNFQGLWKMIILMVVARLSYSLIIFPTRATESYQYSHLDELKSTLELIDSSPLYFHNKIVWHETQLPGVGIQQVPRIARLPYDFTFYYSMTTQQVLQFTDVPIPGAYHLTHWKRWPEEAKVIHQFYMEEMKWTIYQMP